MIDVLIVDDDDAFGELTQQRLEEHGLIAEFHHGPFGTMRHIIALSPQVVIMDVNMPGLLGTSFIELLRGEGMDIVPRVLLMSSMDEAQLARLAKEHNAEAYLTKSVERTRLLAVVESLLTDTVASRTG